MGELAPWHWVIVAVVFLVLFGSRKLPDAARSLGRSLRLFKAEVGDPAPGTSGDPAPGTSGDPGARQGEDPAGARAPDGRTGPATPKAP